MSLEAIKRQQLAATVRERTASSRAGLVTPLDRDQAHGVPKVHPATRPIEPADPFSLDGFEIPGDPQVMLQMLVEEYARMGHDVESVIALARDPFYQAFHGLWQLLGEEEFRRRISAGLARCGVMRVKVTQAAPPPSQLVELQVPASPQGTREETAQHSE